MALFEIFQKQFFARRVLISGTSTSFSDLITLSYFKQIVKIYLKYVLSFL